MFPVELILQLVSHPVFILRLVLAPSVAASRSHFLLSPELKGGGLTPESNANSGLTRKAASKRCVFSTAAG